MFESDGGASRPGMPSVASFLPVLFFLLLGFVLSGLVVEVGNLIHLHIHNRYRDLIFVSAWVLGPPIALYLGVALRQAATGGIALVKNLSWYHLLVLLLFVSALTLRVRSPSDIYGQPVDTSAGFRIALVTLTGCVLLFRLFIRRSDWFRSWFQGIVGVLTIYALVCLTSTLWSVYWPWTLYKSCEYAVDTALLAAILATVDSPEEYRTLFNWAWSLYGLLLLVNWVEAFIAPDLAWYHVAGSAGAVTQFQSASSLQEPSGGVEEKGIGLLGVQLSGVFPSVPSNRVGEYGAVLAAAALARLLPVSGYRRRDLAWSILLFLFGVNTVFFAQSRSPIAGFALGVFLVFLLSRRVVLGGAIVIIGGVLAWVTGLASLTWEYLQRGQSSEQLESLSGRLEWWAFAWKEYLTAPLTGLGAYAAARFAVFAKLGVQYIANLHSDWVETMVGTGLWGIIPLLVVMILGWWSLVRTVRNSSLQPVDRQLALEAIAVISVVTVRMFFSSNLIYHFPLSFFLPLTYAEYLRRKAKRGDRPDRYP